MSTESLWREVEDLAQAREGSYDCRSMVQDIEATFGPTSLRELLDNEIERLLQTGPPRSRYASPCVWIQAEVPRRESVR